MNELHEYLNWLRKELFGVDWVAAVETNERGGLTVSVTLPGFPFLRFVRVYTEAETRKSLARSLLGREFIESVKNSAAYKHYLARQND